ncbi:MAG: tetratricopeptide repeat protein [Desulfobaccales bacterium]
MINRERPKPGAAGMTGPAMPLPADRRSPYGYGVAGLAVLALAGTLAYGVVGCSAPFSGSGRLEGTPGSYVANVRPSSGDISRLLRNVHYYKLMGQPELGLKELEQAHQENPDNLKMVNALAQSYEELGEFEAAHQLYQEALARQGPHPVLFNNLGFSYYLEGRWQEAETCYRQSLARDPQNVAARNNLGLLYCRVGRQEEARRLWQEAEGVAAADAKVTQAQAALGMPDRAVYARRPEPAPPAAKVTQAPAPKAAVSRLPAPMPAKGALPAQPVMVQKAKSLPAAKPLAQTPAPVAPKPREEARKPAILEKAPPASPGISDRAIAAQKPAPASPAVKVASVSKPKAALAPGPAKALAKASPPAQPLALKESPRQVSKEPATQKPVPVEAKQQAVVPEPIPAAALAQVAEATPFGYPKYLTSAELMDTNIEIRNGTWTRNLAHQTRAWLSQEGFTVATIGNHIDFGATKTMIYYRPGAEKVARAVASTFFPEAGLEPSTKLKQGTDVKILLGADLLARPQLMARLESEK